MLSSLLLPVYKPRKVFPHWLMTAPDHHSKGLGRLTLQGSNKPFHTVPLPLEGHGVTVPREVRGKPSGTLETYRGSMAL